MTDRSERLAPVTYLPGVTPPPGPPTLASVLGEMGDEVDQWAEAAQTGGSARSARAWARGDSSQSAELEDEELDADEIDAPASRDAELRRAENVSMHALTRRGVSRRELERTLRARDLPEDVVSEELDRLEGVGLIDDVALAQTLVGTLQERKGLGRSAIAAELTRRLLAPSAIEYALDLVDTGDELARAREIAQKRAGQLRSLDREVAVRRLSAYLARRGYSGSTVRTAVDFALPARAAGSGVRFR